MPMAGWSSGLAALTLPAPVNVNAGNGGGGLPAPWRVKVKLSIWSVPFTAPTAVGAKVMGISSALPAASFTGSAGIPVVNGGPEPLTLLTVVSALPELVIRTVTGLLAPTEVFGNSTVPLGRRAAAVPAVIVVNVSLAPTPTPLRLKFWLSMIRLAL